MVEVKIRKIDGEGGVYRCTWDQKDDVYVLTCQSPVRIKVHAKKLEEAKDRLAARIMTITGDGEPFLQFFPDLPSANKLTGFFDPKYYDIGYNDSVEWSPNDDVADLYFGGICKKCNLGIGERTDLRRTILSVPRYDFCGFYKDRNLGMMFSEDVIRHLTPALPRDAKIIAVDVANKIARRVTKKFFEVSIPNKLEVSIPKNYELSSGWRCRSCGTQMIHWVERAIGNAMYCILRCNSGSAIIAVKKRTETMPRNKRNNSPKNLFRQKDFGVYF